MLLCVHRLFALLSVYVFSDAGEGPLIRSNGFSGG